VLQAGIEENKLKKRLLFISTIFPNRLTQANATYNFQILYALQDYFEISVVNPIAWHLKIKKSIPFRTVVETIQVYHPTFWYLPRFLQSYYGWFYFFSIKSLINKLWQERSFDIVFSSWLYPDGWCACKIAERYGVPAVVNAIGTDANRLKEGSLLAKKTVDTINTARSVICVSHALKDKLISIGADPGKIGVLYNGVNKNIFCKIDKYKSRQKYNYLNEESIILFVGNLLKTKGIDELLHAFNYILENNFLNHPRLVIAGSGKYEPEIIKKIEMLGIKKFVSLIGNCELSKVAAMMNAADVVCLPSYSEGLPNVIIEALCCNAKIVATDVGGIPELQNNHRNLYLVPPKDSIKLANALVAAVQAECFADNAEDIGTWAEYSQKLSRYLT